MTSEDLRLLALRCQLFNQNGRGVILRFAPEMNVPWHAWGMQPAAFKKNWSLLVSHLKTLPDADRTALVWSPFDGSNYPYPYADSTYYPKKGSEDFKDLDTNGDGKLDGTDDPYLPYLPINSTTMDWVGLSVYWQDQTTTGLNSAPPATRISDILVGQVNRKPNFYETYVVGLGKPMLIASTGAVYYTGGNSSSSPSELSVKSNWWQQWLSANLSSTFPDIKMICISEASNFQPTTKINFDFRITNKTEILSAFKSDLAAAGAASSFSVQWALAANLTTWNANNNPGNHTSGPSSAFSFNSTSSFILVGLLGGAVLLVSVWIGVSFYNYQGKEQQRLQNERRASVSPNDPTRPDGEKAVLKPEVRFVEDNSTIFGGSQDLGRSFDSQMTTSDDVLQQSLESGRDDGLLIHYQAPSLPPNEEYGANGDADVDGIYVVTQSPHLSYQDFSQFTPTNSTYAKE